MSSNRPIPRDEASQGRLPDPGPRGFGSLGSILFLLLAAWSTFLGTLPLSDNSFFTHLATGRLILESGAVPSTDPYSYSAAGAPWTVQSWLPSVVYAGVERLAGLTGLRLLTLGWFLTATGFLWALTRDARSAILRFAIGAAGMVVAAGTWGERPYMVGLVCLCVTLFALERKIAPWLLLPVGWVWANSHGSFPLGLILCAAVVLGTILDARPPSMSVARSELQVSGYLLVGLLLGAVSPLGFRGLTFPFGALMDSGTFRLIREWQAPEFTSVPQRAFLVLLMLSVVAAVRVQRWRLTLPLVVFTAMALLAVRNIVMAMPIVLVVLASGAPSLGTLRSSTRPPLGSVLAVLMVFTSVLVGVANLNDPGLDLDDYPTGALAFVVHANEGRVLTQDYVGNLAEALDGADERVFVDDRADMFPREVLEQYVQLDRGSIGWSDVLEDNRIGMVVWERDAPLGSVLAADSRWQVVFSAGGAVVAQRR